MRHQDDNEQIDQTKQTTVVGRSVSSTSKRSPALVDNSDAAASTGQDNGSKQKTSSEKPNEADVSATPLAQQQPAPSPHLRSPAPMSSSSKNNLQHPRHHHPNNNNNNHHQNTSNNRHKFSGDGYHSQNYNSGRFNSSHHHHHHHHHNNNNNNNNNSINPSSNGATFSAIRSSNQRGHNNSHRHKSNQHHNQLQQQQQDHHQHDQQTPLNGGIDTRDGHQQQHLSAPPYSAVAASSSSPAASLSGSDVATRNITLSSNGRRSAAQTPAAGPPHYVEMHVYAGECVAFQLMDGQEQIITGPATMTMVSQQENPPVPVPVQVPPGHMIHQVADENGTLKQIIFSIMNCDERAHIDSNVINFPNETFRVGSLGELVSTSSSSIGIDCDGSSGEQQATSPSSKSTSASSDREASSTTKNYTNHQRATATVDEGENSSYKQESSKEVAFKTASNHANQSDGDGGSGYPDSSYTKENENQQQQPTIDNGNQEPSYDMGAGNLNGPGVIPAAGGADAPADMDVSMMSGAGQMLAPVDEQMYAYPTCACCCCYCDPSATEAATIAGAQPLAHASSQLPMIGGQQDVIMMPPMQPSQSSMQQGAPPPAGGARSGRLGGANSAAAMGYRNQQASSGHPQQVFHSHAHLAPSYLADATNNINGNKPHTNKGQRGPNSFKQHHGNKQHQIGYERHHHTSNYHHYNSQAAYNGAPSEIGAQNYHQFDASGSIGYKAQLQQQQAGAQAYQPMYSNYENHPPSYVTMANVVSSNVNKGSTSSPAQHGAGGGSSIKGVNHGAGVYNVPANRSYKNDHQHNPIDHSLGHNNDTPPSIAAKRQHYSVGDKGATSRYGSSPRGGSNNSQASSLHGPPSGYSIGGAGGVNQSSPSGSVSPMRPSRAGKGHGQQHNQFNQSHQLNGPRAPNLNYQHTDQDQAGKEETPQSGWNHKQQQQHSSSKNLLANSPVASDQIGGANKQQPIVSKNIPVATSEDISKIVTATSYQQARQQPNSTNKRTASANSNNNIIIINNNNNNNNNNKNDSTNDDTPLSRSPANRANSRQSAKASPNDSTAQQHSKKQIDTGKRVSQETVAAGSPELSRSSRGKQKKGQREEEIEQNKQQAQSMTRNHDKDAAGGQILDEESGTGKEQSSKKELQRKTKRTALDKTDEATLVGRSNSSADDVEDSPVSSKGARPKSSRASVDSSPPSDSCPGKQQIESSSEMNPAPDVDEVDAVEAAQQDQMATRPSRSSPDKTSDKSAPTGKGSSLKTTEVKSPKTLQSKSLEGRVSSIKQPLAPGEPEDDILVLESVLNEDATPGKPTFSVSLHSSFSETNFQSLESIANAAKSTQTTPLREAVPMKLLADGQRDLEASSVDCVPALGVTSQQQHELVVKKQQRSDSKRKTASFNSKSDQVHLNSLPQIRMLNLSCASITANSVYLRWSYIPAIAEKYGVNPNNHHSHGKHSVLMDHFVIESSGSRSVETNTLNSFKIVFQGCSMTCRINQLSPEKIYHFRVRRTALISADSTEHLAVSEILSVTLPSVQPQGNSAITIQTASKHHKSLNQQQASGDVGGQNNSTTTSSSSNTSRGNATSSHQVSTHSSKPNHHSNHNQSIRVMSILRQCRNKLSTNVGRLVQTSLSNCSDTKFASLLLIIFTMFATLLAILINHYIVAPVTE